MDVAFGRTMSKRVIGGALALALASQGCNAKTTMVAGAAGLAAGAIVLASADDCNEENNGFCVFPLVANAAAGYAIMLTSGLVFTGGLLGLSYDVTKEAQQPKPSTAATPPASFEGKNPAATTVALHVRVAARAARCEQAAMMANRLSAIEPELVVALIKGDPYVSHCIAEAPTLGRGVTSASLGAAAPAPASQGSAAPPAPANPAPESWRPGAP